MGKISHESRATVLIVLGEEVLVVVVCTGACRTEDSLCRVVLKGPEDSMVLEVLDEV